MKKLLKTTALTFGLLAATSPFASLAASEQYTIDPTHSFVQFKASHMGFSWLLGRFNDVEGQLQFDPSDITKSSVSVSVNTDSLDTNHAKRNKHLKSDDYISADKFPKATFNSKSVKQSGDDILINGELNFHGVTKTITITAQLVGEGTSPWGDYRRGYQGVVTIDKTDFAMQGKAGDKKADMVELQLFIEAIKAK